MHLELALQLHFQGHAFHHARFASHRTPHLDRIHSQFHDNELHRTVYLEAEFHNLVQGDMDITQYTGRLKYLPDALHDVG